MAKTPTKNLTVRRKLVKRHDETKREEYGVAQRGFLVCRRCHNIKFKKSWHAPEGVLLRQTKHSRGGVDLTICPACRMIEDGVFEGELRVENVPSKYERELVNLITGFGLRARRRNAQARIIDIRKMGNGMFITTTENQLAVRLAKKIKDVFNKVEIKTSYSKEPDEVVRVKAHFL